MSIHQYVKVIRVGTLRTLKNAHLMFEKKIKLHVNFRDNKIIGIVPISTVAKTYATGIELFPTC